MAELLKCSTSECKQRLASVGTMSFRDLEEYNTKCCHCGNWIHKESDIANKTYEAISNRWAVEFMNQQKKH